MEVITRAEAKEQGLSRYFTGKPCKRGHIAESRCCNGSCYECDMQIRTENKKSLAKKKSEYQLINRDKIAKYKAEYRDNNKDKIARYRVENKGKIAKQAAKYQSENPLSQFTRRTLHRIEQAKGAGRINRAEAELGYTQQEFMRHIESLWVDGMSWSNRSEWHIDHIKPLSQFIKEGVTDPKIINALSNLQPLWAKDNLSKGSKFETN